MPKHPCGTLSNYYFVQAHNQSLQTRHVNNASHTPKHTSLIFPQALPAHWTQGVNLTNDIIMTWKKSFCFRFFQEPFDFISIFKKAHRLKKKKQFRWIQAHSVQPIFQINYLSVRALHIFSWNYCQILQEQQAIRKWKQALNKRLGSKKTSSYYTTATMWHRQTSWSIHKFKQLSVYLKKKIWAKQMQANRSKVSGTWQKKETK